METITIPSPSAFLRSPIIPAAKPPPQPPPKRKKSATSTKSSPKKSGNYASSAGPTKPKQSKSRNGCITCKAKRLKCDETKPACEQCHKRKVVCGGYKKDFKWRPFEETTFTNRMAPQRAKRKDSTVSTASSKHASPSQATERSPGNSERSPSTGGCERESDGEARVDSGVDVEADVPRNVETHNMTQDHNMEATVPSPNFQLPPGNIFSEQTFASPPMMFGMDTPPFFREHTQASSPVFDPNEQTPVTTSLSSMFEDSSHTVPASTNGTSFSGHSPRLIDLLPPGSQLNAQPNDQVPLNTQAPLDQQMGEAFEVPPEMMPSQLFDDDIEEIIRAPEPIISSPDLWLPIIPQALMPSPTHPHSNWTHAHNNCPNSPPSPHFNPLPIYTTPAPKAGSPEMLMRRFSLQTCGILSIKDGPTENPWRTLIWPLAHSSPALYHAIASMTAFHTSRSHPTLRVSGMEHMRRSIRSLASSIHTLPLSTALATTLVLAFSESWDQHISTGIEHLRGAKILVHQALKQHKRKSLKGEDLARLRFLCNTWVYMDVIARLTSVEETDEDENAVGRDFENIVNPFGAFSLSAPEIDPLMGCASTLFPLIGRAANLCRRVQNMESNTIAIISQAMEIKEAVERWQVPVAQSLDVPEDPSAEVMHALQTAEAYRYATLLYLHQAVPEIPSLSCRQLAKKVLVYLATVPLSSRLVIVHIYPLLAAGCEAVEEEDRMWVSERWLSMSSRMWIGNIDRCWEVVQEVWRRRDATEWGRREREELVLRGQRAQQRCREMTHGEAVAKRKFDQEMGGDGEWSFEEMLCSSRMMPGPKRSRGRGSVSSSTTAMQMPVATRRRSPGPITEDLDPELTVRGSLHWVGVMKFWGWEVLLG